MLINECRDNMFYTDDRRRILDFSSEEDKGVNVKKTPLFAYCNLDEASEREMEKFIRYVTNTDVSKSGIKAGLIIETEDRARVERLAADIMICMNKAGVHTGKIYNYSEKDIFTGVERSYLEAEAGAGDIVITGDFLTGSETEELRRQMFLQKETVWGSIMSVLKASKAINIFFATKDIINERFGGSSCSDLKYTEDVFNYHVRFGEMSETELGKEVIKKLETEGFSVCCGFKDRLDDYVRTVYGRSDHKNMEFADSIYRQIIKEHYGKESVKIIDEYSLPVYEKPKSYEESADELNRMTGLRNIKSFIKELSFLYKAGRLEKDLSSLHMVFSGNAGTGKTTVARRLAEIYYSMGIIKKNKLVEVSASDLIAEYIGHTAIKTRNICRSAYDGILFIDEAYSLNPSDSFSGMSFRQDCINTLIQEMENNRDRLVVIMAGYPGEMEDLLNSNPGLRSRIYKTVVFEDYTDNEMFDIFSDMCEERGCILSDRAKEKAMKKIRSLRFEEGFGNGRSVRNMYMQIMQEYMSTEDAAESIVIRPEHISLDGEMSDYEGLKAELNSMAGLENVKSFVKEIMDTNIYMLRKGTGGEGSVKLNNNMLLVGNAGTGKSTVAGIISKMLFHIGVTKSPHAESMSISELISGYVGDASGYLKNKVSKAMGGVLFIDEIYLLNEVSGSIGSEVTGVLLDILENKREDITVIIAGYEEETNLYMSSNQGLKSRIPHVIRFDDYDTEELTRIFEELCRKNDLKVSDGGIEKFRRVIRDEMKLDGFANGRSVRNIFDTALRKHAVKVIEEGISEEDEILTENEILPLHEMKTRVIGF